MKKIKKPKDKWESILGKFVAFFFKISKREEIIKNNEEITIKFEIGL